MQILQNLQICNCWQLNWLGMILSVSDKKPSLNHENILAYLARNSKICTPGLT